jgi:hypothetical protein
MAMTFGFVEQAFDQADDAGRVWKDVMPVGKISVGGDDRAICLVAPVDQLEDQVGVAVGVGEVSDCRNSPWRRADGCWAKARRLGRVAFVRSASTVRKQGFAR